MMYQAEISRTNPTAFIFLIDQSLSMTDKMSSGKSKAEFVSDALNRTLMNLITRCTKSDGTRDYFHVGVIGYGDGEVRNGLSGDLGNQIMQPISKIEANPVRIEKRLKKEDDGAGGIIEQEIHFPVWFEPEASGGTPMCAGLTKVAEELVNWCDIHLDTYPPTILHLTDGESNDGDPSCVADK
ncbi:vWA domain-containing protein [Fastidiosibacter lacustris]|uniref:vWA domain-containing protein n=1 Tax=Fastidiosibacter lacustris TaxID=2056695 RepID=UPI00195AD9E7|nr:vWA domain-containing protein [Fastidiosibacter lacustris]